MKIIIFILKSLKSSNIENLKKENQRKLEKVFIKNQKTEKSLRIEIKSKETKIRDVVDKIEKLKMTQQEKLVFVKSDEVEMDPLTFKTRVLGIFKKTYIEIERELLMKRMDDFINIRIGCVYMCNYCHKKKAIFDCLNCKESLCEDCLNEVHLIFNNEIHEVIYTQYNDEIEKIQRISQNKNLKFLELNQIQNQLKIF